MANTLKLNNNNLWWDVTGLVARKVLMTGILAAGILIPSLAHAQGDSFKSKAKPQPKAPLTLSQAFNRSALDSAVAHYNDILKSTQTNYSRYLKTEQVRLQKWQDATPPRFKSVWGIADPFQTDVTAALNIDPQRQLEYMLSPEIVAKMSKDVIAETAQTMRRQTTTDYLEKTYTQNAMVTRSFLKDSSATFQLIVPEPRYNNANQLMGMSYREALDFSNRHEGWHLLDWEMNFQSARTDTVSDAQQEDARRWITNAAVRDAARISIQRESLADIGALGDMIRDGQRLSLIDSAIKWRDATDDPIHYTQPALRRLKAEIDEYGLEKFRTLSDKDARALYYKVIREATLSDKAMITAGEYAKAAYYDFNYKDDDPVGQQKLDSIKTAFNARAQNDIQMQLGIKFMQTNLEAPYSGIRTYTKESKQRIKAALATWDARSVLINDAWQHDRHVTPQGIIKAYARLQDELVIKMLNDPKNSEVHEAKLIRLQNVFTTKLRTIDYAAENTKRGVKPSAKLLSPEK